MIPWDMAFIILLFGMLLGTGLMLLFRDTDDEPSYVKADRVKMAMVDRVIFTDTAAAFAAGNLRRVVLAAGEPARIALDNRRQKGFPREGTWTSPQTISDFAFTELIPSWNLITPNDTGVLFHVRTRDRDSGEWTPWLRIGSWGRVTDGSRTDECRFGKVEKDILYLNRPADAYQVRATLQSFGLALDATPAIRRIAVVYSGKPSDESLWAKAVHPDPGPPERWARSLDVPFRAQGHNDYAVTGMTCSPTSVSMVLHYWGIDRPTMENCLAIWDDHNELFGNWSNATQRASELGMDAWLERFRNWDQVKELIARGQPVIASIAFDVETFPDSPIFKRGTNGHLLVIRGFTRNGDVIVNDPASADKGNGVIYSAHGLGHAWFGHGGVGYVIRPPAKPLPAALVKLPTTAPSTTAPAVTASSRN